MSNNPDIEEMLKLLSATLDGVNAGEPAGVFDKEFKQIDSYLTLFDLVLAKYAPVLVSYFEKVSDYSLDRDVEAMNKLQNETGLSASEAMNYVLQLKTIRVDAMKSTIQINSTK